MTLLPYDLVTSSALLPCHLYNRINENLLVYGISEKAAEAAGGGFDHILILGNTCSKRE